jgi:hypothetical protein
MNAQAAPVPYCAIWRFIRIFFIVLGEDKTPPESNEIFDKWLPAPQRSDGELGAGMV